jgi:hypothetical protein
MAFSAAEMVWVWPATIVYASDFEDVYPAILTAAAFLFFLGGYFGVTSVLGRIDYSRFAAMAINQEGSPRAYLLASCLASLVLVALGLYRYQGIPPIVGTITSVAAGMSREEAITDLSESRVEVNKGAYFGGTQRFAGAILDISMIGWPYLTLLAWMIYRISRKLMWLPLSLLFFGSSVIFIGGTGNRFQIMEILIILLAGFSMFRAFRLRHIAAATGVIILATLVVVPLSTQTMALMREDDYIEEIAKNGLWRVLAGNGSDNTSIIQLIDANKLDYELGDNKNAPAFRGERAAFCLPPRGATGRPRGDYLDVTD